MDNKGGEAKRFGSILVARSSTARPTDLEVQLRAHCQKMRVHTRLSGAHFIFPQESSLAVRVYENTQEKPPSLEGLVEFMQHFQWTATFFVGVSWSNPFFKRALLLQKTSNDKHNPTLQKQGARIVVVETTSQALEYIKEMANALRKHHLRRNFFEKKHQEMMDSSSANAMAAMRLLSHPNLGLLQHGEAEMLLLDKTLLQMLHEGGEGVPIDARSKQRLQQFFQQDGTTDEQPLLQDGMEGSYLPTNDINPMWNEEMATTVPGILPLQSSTMPPHHIPVSLAQQHHPQQQSQQQQHPYQLQEQPLPSTVYPPYPQQQPPVSLQLETTNHQQQRQAAFVENPPVASNHQSFAVENQQHCYATPNPPQQQYPGRSHNHSGYQQQYPPSQMAMTNPPWPPQQEQQQPTAANWGAAPTPGRPGYAPNSSMGLQPPPTLHRTPAPPPATYRPGPGGPPPMYPPSFENAWGGPHQTPMPPQQQQQQHYGQPRYH